MEKQSENEKKNSRNQFYDEDQKQFKYLTSFLNCYKDKMMLSMKEEDSAELMSVEKMYQATKKGDIDINLDFQNFLKYKDEEKVTGKAVYPEKKPNTVIVDSK